MDAGQVRAESSRLSKIARERFDQRASQRAQKLKDVNEKGVFAAAGVQAAVRRTAHMTLAEGRGLVEGRMLEAVLGPDDSDHVNFLPRGSRGARAVCRLTFDGQPIGTGFLVAPGLILTNNHVIPSAGEAAGFIAEFDYEFDLENQLRSPIVRFTLEPQRLFVTSDADAGLDFTFVAVSPTSIGGAVPIRSFGWLPMDERRDKILEGEPAVIVQHPRGEPKRLCLFAAELVDRLDNHLHYTTDTDGGASGSPVFNRNWQLIGLHHAATTSDDRRRGRAIVVNEGVRVSSIINSLKPESTVNATGTRAEVLAEITAPGVLGDGRPQGPPIAAVVAATVAAAGAVAAAAAATAATATVRDDLRRTPLFEATRIRTRPDDHFDNRDDEHHGYKPDFLGSGALRIDMPKLPASLESDLARIKGSNKFELKYTHYSSICSVSRRLPILTAANIDGPTLKKLARTDRRFEAADIWYFDPRIEKDLQLPPEVYDQTEFDFGHMVRREDPVWGDKRTATMANDDTFYMTNCAPQHHKLNSVTWLKMENAVLAAARENGVRISVFTGPVLSPDDPVVLGVQVPTAFWKIVAYEEDGQLVAHGFMQFQTKLVDEVMRDLEALGQLDRAEEYQVPILDIARVTSLDFGPLLAADVMGTIPESVAGRATPRRRRLDARLIESIFPSGGARRGGIEQDEVEIRRTDRFRELADQPAKIGTLSNEELMRWLLETQKKIAELIAQQRASGGAAAAAAGEAQSQPQQ